MVEVFRLKY